LAVRIYSLAKELKIDSKELVDICTRAGITGKGSALASLADDEVVRLKEFLGGGGRGGAAPARGPRPGTAPSGATALAEPDVVRREDYMAPGGMMGGKPSVLESRTEKPQPIEARKKPAPGGEGSKPAPKAPTAIKLAPLPPSSMIPPPKSAAEELAPQKPDLRLPADAIRASKAGSKPLQEHLRKHEQKRKTEVGGKPRERGDAPQPMPQPLSPPSEGGRERRRGKAAAPKAGESDEFVSALGGREARQLIRKRSATTRKTSDDDEPVVTTRRGNTRIKRTGSGSTAAPRKGKVTLQLPASVRSFSEAVGVSAAQVLRKLMDLGIDIVAAGINAMLDTETVELLAVELGAEVELKQAFNLEDQILSTIDKQEDAAELLEPRPPVITFLGHVDHGKTSLLDKIIGIDVASGESGGITQHIRAYEIERNGRKIAFVDTPGHEAFTEMRARGANVTDIAVLVVAADDGVMPQTEEAISHARAAGVPIVVALNKIDLPGVNVERIFQQLATSGLLPTDWGGDVEVIKTSATQGTGIDDLLETLFTIAELNDLKANPHRAAVVTCL
jgi:translation initiation factor IF-2